MPRIQNQKQKFLDISLPVKPGMMTYPKNPKVRMRERWTGSTFLTEVSFGSHTGTHVDAPRHIRRGARPVDRIPLAALVGPCRVLDMTHCRERVTVEDLRPHRVRAGERVLVKTRNSRRGFKRFYPDYVFLDGDAADFLAKRRIALFGIDSLSVKQRGRDDTRPHTSLLRKNIVIVEGLDLSRVKPGRYWFIGLPLRLAGRDAAPARAILMQ